MRLDEREMGILNWRTQHHLGPMSKRCVEDNTEIPHRGLDEM